MILLLKGACKVSHAPVSSTQAVTWKKSVSFPFAYLREPSTEGRGNWVIPYGHRYWWLPLWGNLLYHVWWQVPYWSPSFSLLALGAYPITRLLALVLGSPNQPWGHNPRYQQNCISSVYPSWPSYPPLPSVLEPSYTHRVSDQLQDLKESPSQPPWDSVPSISKPASIVQGMAGGLPTINHTLGSQPHQNRGPTQIIYGMPLKHTALVTKRQWAGKALCRRNPINPFQD